jgi:hypothetical protein
MLSASVPIDYDKNDKDSYLLLTKVGISLALKSVEMALTVYCISPRLNNA